MKVKTMGFFKMSGSHASEVRGKGNHESFQAAWDHIPNFEGHTDFEEQAFTPTFRDGNRGIFVGKEHSVKFLIKEQK